MRRERNEDTSLSFLDVIACAFGAIVLLVLILPVGQHGAFAESNEVNFNLRELFQSKTQLDEAIAELRSQIVANSANLQQIRKESSEKTQKNASFEEAINKTSEQIDVVVKERLAAESEIDEIRNESDQSSRLRSTKSYAGIPVDSDYVAFVIDISGSMRNVWGSMLGEVRGVLDIYPSIKGFQILSDQGRYLIPGTKGRWMQDSPLRRNQAVSKLASWRAPSASSPAKGIKTAIRDLYRDDQKMAIFVFGDDFSDRVDLDGYIREIESISKSSSIDENTLRIHAIGFANAGSMVYSELRVAVLMRELTRRHNGAFLALPYQEKPLISQLK